LIKVLFILLGLFFLLLAGIGIVLPGLPTTPFVLLAAALFLRSSDTLYNKLLKNRIFGKYLRRYMEQKGMTLKGKISSLILMWIMISLSVYRVENIYFRAVVILLGFIGSAVMLFYIKTVQNEEDTP
jgi:uncharacterized protein